MRSIRQIGSSLAHFVRRIRAGLIISSAVCLVSLGLYYVVFLASLSSPLLASTSSLFQFLHEVEVRTLDTRFLLRGPRKGDSRIVIVAIDQKSEDVLGRWPFPRSYFAQALDFLGRAKARTVVFDINFPQPDENSALQALQKIKKDYQQSGKSEGTLNGQFESRLNAMLARADNDQQFADALSLYPNAILGYFALPPSEISSQDRQRVNDFLNYLSFQTYPRIDPQEYRKMGDVPAFLGVSPNLPKFAQYAKNFGYFNIFPDPDGVVRHESVVAKFQNGVYPSLDVAAVLAYTNASLENVNVVFDPEGIAGITRIELGNLRIRTDPGGFVQIDYRGPSETYATYSLADVVEHKLPPDTFQGKLVLIGPTATGIGDFAVTPFQQAAFPGVEVHANFIDQVLNGRYIRRGVWADAIDVCFLLIFSLGAGVLLSVISAKRATALLALLLGFFLWLAYHVFVADRLWIVVTLPVATLCANYGAIVSYRFFFEEREKKKVRGAFQQYLPPGLINQLMERPELLRLGGEEKELTVMFSDIRGFTALSEGLSPQVLVELLNEYLSEMTDVIFRHWGTLDKYIGDAIMAFWGAPYPQTDHAERACRTALDMLRSLHQLRESWAERGRPLIDIGVGVNTGTVLVGNMGSKRRFNFTIMGDNVNLASRLEGLNKEFGTRLIISQYTYEKVRESFVARELDLIRVKGKKMPVKIYELMGPVEERGRFDDLASRFEQGLAEYRAGRWEAALEVFGELLKDYPQDGPANVFADRCRDLLARPPEAAWDGVYVMKTK